MNTTEEQTGNTPVEITPARRSSMGGMPGIDGAPVAIPPQPDHPLPLQARCDVHIREWLRLNSAEWVLQQWLSGHQAKR